MKYFILVLALLFATPTFAQDRYAAIVVDARTNEILLEDQAQEPRIPASLTKMMTLYMLFEAIENNTVTMDTTMIATRNASRQAPTRLGLRRGSRLTVEQAINALVVQSANDVATMIAEHLSGSESRFASRMTARARELGLQNTRFGNASGLPNPNNETTAYDMALLSQALWRDFPQYYHFFSTSSYRGARNHNRLLGVVEGMDGIKTGYTRASGFNLATMTERNGIRIIVVVMGGASAAERDAQVQDLVEVYYSTMRPEVQLVVNSSPEHPIPNQNNQIPEDQ